MMHSASNITKDFLEFVKNEGISFDLYKKMDEDEETEIFTDYLEIVDFYGSNDVKITNIWDVNNNGTFYYEVDYIDLEG